MASTRCIICGRFMSNDASNAFVLMQPGRAGLACCFGSTSSQNAGTFRLNHIQEHHGRHRRIGFRTPTAPDGEEGEDG